VKINIAPYPRWFGPYQLAEKILFWKDRDDDAVFAFGDWLDKYTPIARISQWFFSKRKVEVRIDPQDTWSMDHTLALIILPMLKQLKETKHGSPFVDDADIPEELQYLRAPKTEDEHWAVNPDHDKRWDWVISEMIWAFEQIVDDTSNEQFYDNSVTPYVFDRDGYSRHEDRIQRGTMLFGKYYQGLWD
jgi:hypothetical protein